MRAKFTPPDFVPGCEVQSIADKDEYTTNNGWIEATIGPHNQQRVRYYGVPGNIQVGSFVDVEYFPGYRLYRVFGNTQGGTATVGGIKVSEVWEKDLGAVAAETDNDGNLTINGTRTLTIPTDLIHAGDTDTKISFTDDDVEIFAGSLSMLKLTETTQDLVEIGDTAGGGDVDINVNAGQMFLQGSSGNFGVGTTTPSVLFEVLDEATFTIFASSTYSSTASHAPLYYLNRARNTEASPSDVLNGDQLGIFSWRGYIGGFIANNATMAVLVDGAPNTQVPALIRFAVGTDTTTADAEGALLSINGSNQTVGVGLGATTPLAKLHIDQASTTAAIPVLYLDQADVSEEMIEFNTTIGVGNAIEAAGAKTLTTTHFIKVTLPGALTRYIPVGTIA